MYSNFEEMAKKGIRAQRLANLFSEEYFKDKSKTYPINPFQIMEDLGIVFVLRPFKNYEGIYIAAKDEFDYPIVGINVNRPITRQRFTAAHELCHHLKDLHSGHMCEFNPESELEKYAEAFASELLMPTEELKKQVKKYEKNGFIDYDGILCVAQFFGVSFQACLFKVAYKLHKIEGDINPDSLRKSAIRFKPNDKKREKHLYDVVLYEQLLNAASNNFNFEPTEFACKKFKSEYIYFDSRLEGIRISQEEVADIVMDLRWYRQSSVYCTQENQNIVEVAGLTLAYDYAFENIGQEISIYDANKINEKLFSTAPYPEFGGKYRESNTLVLGAKFETMDYHNIAKEMYFLNQEIAGLIETSKNVSLSSYVEAVVRIHHKMTVIHPFRDGNGRTSRIFTNMLLMRKKLFPVFFKDSYKDEYKNALSIADQNNSYELLYEVFFKAILNSSTILTNVSM